MDLIQVTYKSRMVLFRDSPSTLVDGAWHLCPPGAVVYPGWHSFGSQIWDPNERNGDAPAIGEQPGKLGYQSGLPTPGYTGKRFCGSADVWLNGDLLKNQGSLTLDGRGRPVCCGAADPGLLRIGGQGFDRCAFCPTAQYRRYQVVVTGVVGAGNCTLQNRTYIVTRVPTPGACEWHELNPPMGSPWVGELDRTAAGWFFIAHGLPGASSWHGGAGGDCLSPISLPFQDSTPSCSSPASVANVTPFPD